MKTLKLYEVIGGTFSATKSEVQLSDGQKLEINSISMIHFQSNEGVRRCRIPSMFNFHGNSRSNPYMLNICIRVQT